MEFKIGLKYSSAIFTCATYSQFLPHFPQCKNKNTVLNVFVSELTNGHAGTQLGFRLSAFYNAYDFGLTRIDTP